MAYSQRLSRKAIAWLVGAMLVLPLTASAGVPTPVIPKAKAGTTCVEPANVMRREHMKFLLHHREEVVRQGIRTKKFSLVKGIAGHTAPDKSGAVARIGTPEHFCSTCHNFAAVNIDCFECHADKPENTHYRHSLAEGDTPHHPGMKSEDKVLSGKTLEIITAKGEKQ